MADILFIGLSLGSILLLIALGLSIIYGTMGVINMAHGELAMIGAYTAVLAGKYLGIGLIGSIPLGFLVAAVLGLVIERLVIRRLYRRIMDTLLATWGIAILLQQAIRLQFGLSFFGINIDGLGPGLQSVSVPAFLRDPVRLGDFVLQPYRSFIIVMTLILTGVTWLLLYRSAWGIQIRAIMRNPEMAAACGIDVRRVGALIFAFGSGLAGVAGVLLAGLKTVSPDMGASLVVDGFLVVVVGGVGSLVGTLISAGLLGQISGIFASVFNDIAARAVVLAVVIAVIMWRPSGLFNFKGR
ncbi:urea ABC transporter permease subunit UrtB [Paracoccus limosus]|uniref:Urea ABC transporter permease subunit UrtB n=1 Tax=Paracoccus limosus TaxID=913252 RepID=A0A844H8L9_9RHOB|nr:urea ABC transporter permease subunit UrtB [Paracoccus limosus]